VLVLLAPGGVCGVVKTNFGAHPSEADGVPSRRHGWGGADVLVVFQVLGAVAICALTLAAIAKVHLGVGLVGDAADRAAMVEGGAGVLRGKGLRLPGHVPAAVKGELEDVIPEKQEKVADRCQGTQARAPVAGRDGVEKPEPGEHGQPNNSN